MLLSFLYFLLVMFIPFFVYQKVGIGFASITLLVTIVSSVIVFDVVKDKMGHYIARRTVLKNVQSKCYSKEFKKLVTEKYKESTANILKLHPALSFIHIAAVGSVCLFFCLTLANNLLTIAECVIDCAVMLIGLQVLHLVVELLNNNYSFLDAFLLSTFRMSLLTGRALAASSVIILGLAIIKISILAMHTGGQTSIITPIVGIVLFVFFIKELCNET